MAEPEHEVLVVVEPGEAVAIARRLAGRHVGPLEAPAGRLTASGAHIEVRLIDVLTFTDGRISSLSDGRYEERRPPSPGSPLPPTGGTSTP